VSSRHALACEECRRLLGGYVLAALEPEEMEAVRAHVATCAACAREHASLAPLPMLLDAAGSAEPVAEKPPAALEDAVLDRFARERPRPHGRRRRLRTWLARPVPAAVMAAVAAALVTLAVSALLDGSEDSGARAYGARLHGLAAAPGARAYAKLTTQAAGTQVDLYVRGVRPAPGTSYELWCIGNDGTRVSAGTFRVDASGRAHVRMTTAARLGEYERLSVERLTPGQPGQRVMAGEIEY
jgi:anti-sigma-K factor RskA